MTTTMMACALTLMLSAKADKHVKFETLPEVVRARVQEKFPKAKVVDAELEKGRDGKDVYEVKLMVEGAKTEISITPEGTVVSVERIVAWKSAPAEVKKALASSAAKDLKVERAEEVTEGEAVSWEVTGTGKDGKRVEVVIDAQGGVTVKTATE